MCADIPSSPHPDGRMRCPWPGTDPLYVAYHDKEWGVPEFDSRALFEKLILDGFQAGLSWITILRKRDAFRAAFANFDPEKIACFNAKKIAALMNNPGITLIEKPVPQPGPAEVLVRVDAIAVCATDIEIIRHVATD